YLQREEDAAVASDPLEQRGGEQIEDLADEPAVVGEVGRVERAVANGHGRAQAEGSGREAEGQGEDQQHDTGSKRWDARQGRIEDERSARPEERERKEVRDVSEEEPPDVGE